jgi:hypothetical protein
MVILFLQLKPRQAYAQKIHNSTVLREVPEKLYGNKVHGQTGLEGTMMKLGDGTKVTMHRTPKCLERAELHTESLRWDG